MMIHRRRRLFRVSRASASASVGQYTVSQKTSHIWFAITWTYVNGVWYIFGRNVTDKVSNQKMFYYITSNNLCFCTAWQNGKHESCIFDFFTRYISALPEFNQRRCLFFSIFLTDTDATVWLPKSCNQCVQLGAFVGVFTRKEVESAAVVGLCCTHKAPV